MPRRSTIPQTVIYSAAVLGAFSVLLIRVSLQRDLAVFSFKPPPNDAPPELMAGLVAPSTPHAASSSLLQQQLPPVLTLLPPLPLPPSSPPLPAAPLFVPPPLPAAAVRQLDSALQLSQGGTAGLSQHLLQSVMQGAGTVPPPVAVVAPPPPLPAIASPVMAFAPPPPPPTIAPLVTTIAPPGGGGSATGFSLELTDRVKDAVTAPEIYDAKRGMLDVCVNGHRAPGLFIIGCMKCGTSTYWLEITSRIRTITQGTVLGGEFWFSKKEKV